MTGNTSQRDEANENLRPQNKREDVRDLFRGLDSGVLTGLLRKTAGDEP